VNNVKWGECPYCKIQMNGYQFYPAGILMMGSSDLFVQYICSNKKCKKEITVNAIVTVKFIIDKGVKNGT
jgi:hypothetical protein